MFAKLAVVALALFTSSVNSASTQELKKVECDLCRSLAEHAVESVQSVILDNPALTHDKLRTVIEGK
eukprot:Awhi_evm2s12304